MIIPPGLSLLRRWYIHDKIREFCQLEVRDVVCPDLGRVVAVQCVLIKKKTMCNICINATCIYSTFQIIQKKEVQPPV